MTRCKAWADRRALVRRPPGDGEQLQGFPSAATVTWSPSDCRNAARLHRGQSAVRIRSDSSASAVNVSGRELRILRPKYRRNVSDIGPVAT
jgi:hypothetical protein